MKELDQYNSSNPNLFIKSFTLTSCESFAGIKEGMELSIKPKLVKIRVKTKDLVFAYVV